MAEIFSSNGEARESKGEKLAIICNDLNTDEQQLIRLQKENGTKTARVIVGAYYPPSVRVNIKPEDIDDQFRHAIYGKFLHLRYVQIHMYILDYIQLFHGMEGLTQGKVNESINNVFRSAKSQRKKDMKLQNVQSTTSISVITDNNKSADDKK